MRIKKYRPTFFDGFEDVYYDINSKEELLTSELCKWSIEHGYVIEFSYHETQSCIMAVKKDRSEWWVLALIDEPQDMDVLKDWLPVFSTGEESER